MKKVLSFILICTMLFSVVAGPLAYDTTVFAQEEGNDVPTDPEGGEGGEDTPTDPDGDEPEIPVGPEYITDATVLLQKLREAMLNREESITLYFEQEGPYTEADFAELYEQAFAETGVANEGDYLRFRCESYSIEIESSTEDEIVYQNKIEIQMTYTKDAEQENAVASTVEQALLEIGIADLRTEYEKAKAIYEYICQNSSDDSACLFYYMARETGLDARIISGQVNGEAHTWNIVKIGYKYYNLDAALDAMTDEYQYFLKGSESFTDHQRDERYLTEEFTTTHPMDAKDFVPNQLSIKRIWMENPGAEVKPGDQVKVYVEAEASDGLSGISVFMKSEEKESSTASASASINNEIADGIYELTFRITESMYPGKWTVSWYTMSDKYGSDVTNYRPDSTNLWFTVLNEEPTENRLVLNKVWMENPGEKVKVGDEVKIYFDVESENGLGTISALFKSEVYPTSTLAATASASDKLEGNVYEMTIKIRDDMYPGKWIINWFRVMDKYGTKVDCYNPDISQICFEVENGEVTDNKLELKRIWMENPGKTVGVADRVDIFVEVESSNGMGMILLNLKSEEYSSSTTTASAFSPDEVEPGIYKATVKIIDQMYPGKWILDGYTIEDKFGTKISSKEVSSFDIQYVIRDKVNRTSFTDISADDWYYDCVKYVSTIQLMKGTSATTFEPQSPLTRAQFATLIHRVHGEPDMAYSNRFSDIPSGTWYSEAVLWAADKGIVTGFPGGIFKPNDNISREQMAVMMYRYAQYRGLAEGTQADLVGFADGANVSSWAKEAMQWAVGVGLINGKGDNNLDPQGVATRAECATIIMRFSTKMID